eukprot:5486578-Prymnesium_polylepis.1
MHSHAAPLSGEGTIVTTNQRQSATLLQPPRRRRPRAPRVPMSHPGYCGAQTGPRLHHPPGNLHATAFRRANCRSPPAVPSA